MMIYCKLSLANIFLTLNNIYNLKVNTLRVSLSNFNFDRLVLKSHGF